MMRFVDDTELGDAATIEKRNIFAEFQSCRPHLRWLIVRIASRIEPAPRQIEKAGYLAWYETGVTTGRAKLMPRTVSSASIPAATSP